MGTIVPPPPSPPQPAINSSSRALFTVDINGGEGIFSADVGFVFSSLVDGAVNAPQLWSIEPTFIPQPETILSRSSDWDDAGIAGDKFVQGFILEADTQNAAKNVGVQSSDDMVIQQVFPVQFNGQSLVAFSFANPFIAHSMRLVPQDPIPWRMWRVAWIFEPVPELVTVWKTEGTSHGMVGWHHIKEISIAHISTADLTFILTTETGGVVTLTIPNSGGKFIKTPPITLPPMKGRLFTYSLTSTAGFRLFVEDSVVKVGEWGRQGGYTVVRPLGGPSKAPEAIV